MQCLDVVLPFVCVAVIGAAPPAYAQPGWTPAAICAEAASEALQPNTPKSIRQAILRACERAMAGAGNKAACDREAAAAKAGLQFPIAYTCVTAVSIAGDG